MMTWPRTARAWMPLAAASAWWLEKLVTVEWSYPYCSILDDGPAGAVYGFPFPYEHASIVTSATSFFIPWLYLLNLFLIATGIFLLMRPLAARVTSKRFKFVVGTAGVLLLTIALAFDSMVLSLMDVWRPVTSFQGSPEYSQLRPVAVRAGGRQRDCTASPFWFGTQRHRAPN